MSSRSRDLTRGDCLSPTNPALLQNPLEFIHEDHLREREICALIDQLAGADEPMRRDATCVLSFLINEMPLHLQDEEEDLFPLLRQRCAPEDEIDRAIARLSSDHEHAGHDTPGVVAILTAIEADGRAITEVEKPVLTNYAAHARTHLILENAIILPFARLRLTKADLDGLRHSMMSRRGLDQLVEAPDAD